MAYTVDINKAGADFPNYDFISALTPSVQKAAFHVKNQDGKDLCMKLISPDYELDRLNREIQAMQSISHPNIVSLVEYTFSTTPQSRKHFIIEEFIEGEDLEDRFGVAWEREKVSEVFGKIFDGLNSLHDEAIVHRDLKPSNIRIKPDDEPVIIDFGLARHLNLSDLTETHEGAAFGTPIYFAPEQFQGTKHEIDHRTDIFAVGLMIFRALTGENAFYTAGMNRSELQDKVCNSDEYIHNAKFVALPSQWQLFIKKLLAKERAKRVNSAAQAGILIRKIAAI